MLEGISGYSSELCLVFYGPYEDDMGKWVSREKHYNSFEILGLPTVLESSK